MRPSQHNVSSPTLVGLAISQRAGVALSADDAARFWSKVARRGLEECWLWLASKSGGSGAWYGHFSFVHRRRQRFVGAHRVAWILTHGPIPGGQHVLHACDVPSCCNPSHLFLGTHTDNVRDAANKGRLHVARPKKQRVSATVVSQIKALRADGEKLHVIAHRFLVSESFVSLVASGKRRQYDSAGAA